MAIDIKLKDGYLSGPNQNQETQALLRVIIDELKNIGVYLAQQNNRIEEISKKTGNANASGPEPISSVVSYIVLNVRRNAQLI
jgi:hypothetical protein